MINVRTFYVVATLGLTSGVAFSANEAPKKEAITPQSIERYIVQKQYDKAFGQLWDVLLSANKHLNDHSWNEQTLDAYRDAFKMLLEQAVFDRDDSFFCRDYLDKTATFIIHAYTYLGNLDTADSFARFVVRTMTVDRVNVFYDSVPSETVISLLEMARKKGNTNEGIEFVRALIDEKIKRSEWRALFVKVRLKLLLINFLTTKNSLMDTNYFLSEFFKNRMPEYIHHIRKDSWIVYSKEDLKQAKAYGQQQVAEYLSSDCIKTIKKAILDGQKEISKLMQDNSCNDSYSEEYVVNRFYESVVSCAISVARTIELSEGIGQAQAYLESIRKELETQGLVKAAEGLRKNMDAWLRGEAVSLIYACGGIIN